MFTQLQENESLARSFSHCHALGVDSIVVAECKETESLERVFMTTSDHVLHRNKDPFARDLSVAIHMHHCDIELVCLQGEVENILITQTMDPTYPTLETWEYIPAITNGGKGRFSYCPGTHLNVANVARTILRPGYRLRLHANEMHTVYVPGGVESAWLIRESPSRYGSNNSSICWSNNHDLLEKFNFGDYYKPLNGGIEKVREVHRMLMNFSL